jgi:hypothetical protein
MGAMDSLLVKEGLKEVFVWSASLLEKHQSVPGKQQLQLEQFGRKFLSHFHQFFMPL